jgi:murein DD-endopeptidase MepM/ murein hydrolase activator NlpD
LQWPVRGRVLRGFDSGAGGENQGLDIGVPPGTEVKAAAAGTVTYAGTLARAYGPLVIIEHEGRLFTVYSRLRERYVARGQEIEAGEVIGTSGDASAGSRPHLHFEVRKEREPRDPLLFLPSQ